MEILWIIAAMMLFLIIKGIYDKKKARERLIFKLQEDWGKLSEEEYTEAKYKSLQYYFKNKFQKKQTLGFLLDDITWNDLNLDELFFMINRTGSAMGEEVLWAMLHELQVTEAPLKEREKLISFFQNNSEARLKLQTNFALIGKNSKVSLPHL